MRLFVTGASDGVIHLAFRHGEALDDAATTDTAAIETFGDPLAAEVQR